MGVRVKVGLRYGSRHQPRRNALQVNDDDATIRVLLFDSSDDFGFSNVRFDRDARWEGPTARPDCDGTIWVAVQDDDLCARMSKFGRQDHGGGRFTGSSLR